MSYRDDLEAALARIAALEGELARATRDQDEIVRLKARVAELEQSAASPPPAQSGHRSPPVLAKENEEVDTLVAEGRWEGAIKLLRVHLLNASEPARKAALFVRMAEISERHLRDASSAEQYRKLARQLTRGR